MNNRWLGLPLLLSSLTAGSTPAVANDAHVQARLAGSQEAPVISTTGRGSFRATLSDDATVLEFRLSYSGMEGTVTAAHIHVAQKGVNGGIAAFLCGGPQPACPQGGVVEGKLTAADVSGPAAQGIAAGEFQELIRAIAKGDAYVNVHSSKFPAGEVRGQIQDVDHKHEK